MDLEINVMLEEGNRTMNMNADNIGTEQNGLFTPIYEYQVINDTFDVGQSIL